LPENAGKLVYNYALGVGNSTDPSGIDAEASIKQGAHIIYQDTNNSTNDFHERQKFSIRGE
jgi:ABC-type tungstate transport system permease subunit